MNSRHCWIFVYLMALSLEGCVIPIHVDEEEPYTERAAELLVGHTTRNYVLRHFGKPSATYSHGSEFIYTAYEKNWEIPYFLPGAPSAAGVTTVGDRHFLILDFDERGILTAHRLEVGKGRADCTDSGICHGKAPAGHIVRKADKLAEIKAKEFLISGNQCGLYLYLEGYSVWDRISVALNGENLGQVNLVGSGFFYLMINPGRSDITANLIRPNPNSATLSVTCKENELLFVRLKINESMINPEFMELVDDSKGRKKIKRRILIIPQSSSQD
jgi:hypothetical protein